MEFRRLRYFLRIAAEGSLAGASRAIGIAQPALSRQMQLLEQELGVQLFQRVPSGMRLTEEGEYLRDSISHPLSRIEIALDNVRSFPTHMEASATIGLPPVIAGLLGSPLIAKLADEMPKLKLRLIEDSPARLASQLGQGTVDMAVLPGLLPDDRLFHSEIMTEPLLLIAPPDADVALDADGKVPFGDLPRYPLILPSRPANVPVLLDKLAARFSIRLNVAGEVDSLDVRKQLVAAGTGFTILPPLAVRDEIAAGSLCAHRFAEPEMRQSVHYAVQEHWRIARSTYNEFHQIFFAVWQGLVSRGDWPATWAVGPEIIEQALV